GAQVGGRGHGGGHPEQREQGERDGLATPGPDHRENETDHRTRRRVATSAVAPRTTSPAPAARARTPGGSTPGGSRIRQWSGNGVAVIAATGRATRAAIRPPATPASTSPAVPARPVKAAVRRERP